jgi:uncharacterized membrane protein HdeD (DUF308 family)
MLTEDVAKARSTISHLWEWMLVGGIAWLIISVVVLRFTQASITTVGVLLGVVFLVAAVEEFAVAYIRSSWKWAHALLGILFAAGAIWSFVHPNDAFWSIAAAFGFLLVLAGSLTIVDSTMSRAVNPIWGLGLVTGILEILLGFWASQQLFPVRGALLLVWIGFYALFRGIADIVMAFELHSQQKHASVA